MLRIAIFVLLLFAFAFAFGWLADNPGSVLIRWPWLGSEVEISLLQAIVALAFLIVAVMLIWSIVSAVLHSPEAFGRWRAGRRRDKGYDALSRGLVAAGAGNAPLAHRLSKESARYLDDEPLVALLDAQTALLEGKHDAAREKFSNMLERDETKLLGLRGLYVEAEKANEREAAFQIAREAHDHAPATPWAAKAVLKAQALGGEWEKALKTLEANRNSGLIEKEDYAGKRAAVLTALAQQEEGANPDAARSHALAAHKLLPGFAPAGVTAARLSARLGDIRKAAKVLEACWKQEPHPEVAETYVHLRQGDSALDRLARAEALAAKRANHPEGQFAVAKAAADAGEWKKARDAMRAVLADGANERACLLMADIEEGEHGDRGRVREWLARAVSAPRDAAWTADGIVADEWAPVSPVSGRIGAFEWKVPVAQLGGPGKTVDYSALTHEPPMPETMPRAEAEAKIEEARKADIEDATIVDVVSVTSAAGAAGAASAARKGDVSSETARAGTVDAKSSGMDAKSTASSNAGASEAMLTGGATEPAQRPVAVAAGTPDKPGTSGKPADPKADSDTPGSDDPARKDAEPQSGTAATASRSNNVTPLPLVEKPADVKAKRQDDGAPKTATPTGRATPYKNTDFDEDGDGLIDRRPDDPGTEDGPPKKKGLLF